MANGHSIFFGVAIFLATLLYLPSSFATSLIDSQFKLSRQTQNKKQMARQEVDILYKQMFSRSMYSNCRWFPSDSEYMRIMSRRCGSAKGLIKGYARFTTEFEAFRLSEGSVNDHGRLRFVQFGDDCDLL
jgi:hypothetical protein